MSTLQLGVLVAGALVLVAVAGHTAWVWRRSRPRQAEPESQLPARIEPEGLVGAVAADGAMPLPVMEKKAQLDSLIDVIAPLQLDAPLPGETILSMMPATRRVGSKPLAIEGYNETRGQWELPLPGQSYVALQAGVQLANRSGALNEIEYSEFVVKIRAFADALGAEPVFPDMLHEVARARELDSFASAHDAQLGMNLHARDAAWSPGYVQQIAVRHGFVSGLIPGRMVLPALHGGTPLLVLGYDSQAALAEDPAQSAIWLLQLSLDVGQVDSREQPFVRMRDVALQLAQAMGADLTDDDGQPLGQAELDRIGYELDILYDNLDARDLSAGSTLARRLFS